MQLLQLTLLLLVVVGAAWAQDSADANDNDNDNDYLPATKEPLEFLARPRIVGGTRAAPRQFPHQVSLRVRGGHVCGGSIIAANYVVTAAHCIVSGQGVLPASQLSIQAGSLHLNSGGVYINVAEVHPHPSYNAVTNDVAVLRLASALPFDANIGPIALASADPPNNAAIIASGWGRVRAGGDISNDLLYVRLSAISRAQCSRFMGDYPESIICLLHGPNMGVCHGDSGGPAVYNGQLIGVTSFVLGSCARLAPDGFTRIPAVRSWVASVARL